MPHTRCQAEPPGPPTHTQCSHPHSVLFSSLHLPGRPITKTKCQKEELIIQEEAEGLQELEDQEVRPEIVTPRNGREAGDMIPQQYASSMRSEQ